jgi:predicted transcriptional regulator
MARNRRMEKMGNLDPVEYRYRLGKTIGSVYKSNIVKALGKKNPGPTATELYEQSGARSQGSFFHHLHDLERWDIVYKNDQHYMLTELGKRIARDYNKIEVE